ncbi:MAG: hypothetical protein LBR29_10140, partial [Methylobacteriaceae bacterium]|nr:hypothetical protein [Methylobacteriaceae bacterium]
NVVAITAAAGEHRSLFVFGLLLSIPLIVCGSTLIMLLIQRFPIFIWAGGGLLGWIAGEMIVNDQKVLAFLGSGWSHLEKNARGIDMLYPEHMLLYGAAVFGAVIVLLAGLAYRYHGTTHSAVTSSGGHPPPETEEVPSKSGGNTA